jgi:hypothetical protein
MAIFLGNFPLKVPLTILLETFVFGKIKKKNGEFSPPNVFVKKSLTRTFVQIWRYKILFFSKYGDIKISFSQNMAI